MNAPIPNVVAIAILLIGGAGWYWYGTQSPRAPIEPQMNSETVEAFSASFLCADGRTRFEATFPDATKVDLARDGVVFRTLPRVEGAGERFEDDEYTYIFAGEEVEVITKATNSTITCSQPIDSENAPVNFGDRGEGAGIEQDLAAITTQNILGTWQDSTDTRLLREFKTNGVFIDSRDGTLISRGEWKVFTDEDAPAVSFEVKPGRVYMTITTADAPGDTTYIKVNNLTPEQLHLVSMDRPGMSFYSRVQ